MSEVDVFLIGAPKAGTTWLAYTLNQHTKIDLSDPKEPNIIASHRGTFIRTDESPEWNKFKVCFQGEGLKLDASIHAFLVHWPLLGYANAYQMRNLFFV